MVDASHIDQKKRGILDMKDTLIPLVNVLTRKEFRARFGDTKDPLELMFY